MDDLNLAAAGRRGPAARTNAYDSGAPVITGLIVRDDSPHKRWAELA
jgi:hypothetical protein